MRATLAAGALVLLACGACARRSPEGTEAAPSAEPAPTVPPVAATPDAPPETASAAPPEKAQTPYEQARAYFANGQVWLARLVLEPKALGSDGTKSEVELLGQICEKQGDTTCAGQCARKLGKKSLDAGATPPKKGRR